MTNKTPRKTTKASKKKTDAEIQKELQIERERNDRIFDVFNKTQDTEKEDKPIINQ